MAKILVVGAILPGITSVCRPRLAHAGGCAADVPDGRLVYHVDAALRLALRHDGLSLEALDARLVALIEDCVCHLAAVYSSCQWNTGATASSGCLIILEFLTTIHTCQGSARSAVGLLQQELSVL